MGEITTVGKVLLKAKLPRELRSFVDKTPLDGKGIGQLTEKLVETHPNDYKHTITDLTRFGFEVSTRQGSTVHLEHLQSPIDKQKMFKEIDTEVEKINRGPGTKDQKDEKILKLYQDLSTRMNKEILDEGLKRNHTLAKIVLSGSRGSPTQYRQTVAAPVLVDDAKGRPMTDFPVQSSFAEGLTLPEYLAHSYGSRRGSAASKLSVADSGYLAKQTTRAAMTTRVEEHDCGTNNGLSVPVSDRDSIGAFLAQPVGGHNKNNEVTARMLNELVAKKIGHIVVRSPITCESSKHFHGGAVCQLCVGRRERQTLPQLGEYVGITAASTLGERLSQGMLNSRHGSGSSKGGQSSVTGFKLVNQLFNIPKSFQDKAVVADSDGVITDIREAPQGGHYVKIDKTEHYVPTGLTIKVSKGTRVEAGDVLSTGIVNPAEIVRYKGIGEGRKYFTESMRDTFKDLGMPITRRNFELISKSAIDHVRVTNDADPHSGLIPGQVMTYQSVQRDYHTRPDSVHTSPDRAIGEYLEEPVLHYTIGTRITQNVVNFLKIHGVKDIVVNKRPPPFVPEMQRLLDVPMHEHDWMHQLYSTYLEKRFIHAVNTGAQSNTKGPSPVAGLAYGVGFGEEPAREKKSEEIDPWEEYDENNVAFDS